MTQEHREELIEVRTLDSIADYEAAEVLQRDVWQTSDRFVTPLHVMLTAQHNGGLVLGAFDPAGADGPLLVGFLFGFPGQTEGGQWKHCSHMLAVRPEYQNRGIGQRLKREQAQFVRDQGISLITWTVDPLLVSNNHLNFRKLGVICRRYHQNWYGSDIGGGMPSDRFEVEWHVGPSAERIAALRASVREVQAKNPDRSGDFVSTDMYLSLPTQQILETAGALIAFEAPQDFAGLMERDWDRALAVRLRSREVLSGLMQQGYWVMDLCREEDCTYYVIAKEEEFV